MGSYTSPPTPDPAPPIRRLTVGFEVEDDGSPGTFYKEDGSLWLRKADGTEVELGSGNGGESSFLEQSVVPITDAEWKALPVGGATIEVVPAPGPGKAIYCPAVHGLGFVVIAFDWHVDYTNVAAGTAAFASFTAGAPGAGNGSANYKLPANFLRWGTPILWPIAPTFDLLVGGNAGANDSALIEDTPVLLSFTNGVLGAFTGGDPANSFTVSTAYYVYDV